jgi:hypothetical protein
MITSQDIRMWIFDRNAADNELLDDLEFTDKEIGAAMRHAAREFNSIFPRTVRVDPSCLPDGTNLFFEATAEMLYRMRLHSLRRNNFEYRGGSVTVNDVQPKIAGMEKALEELRHWRTEARDLKSYTNLSGFYGKIG